MIRHASDDRIIALIEILSAGNKSSNKEFRTFVTKAVNALDRGHHLLLVDLHPRTDRDPAGIHPVIWTELGGKSKPTPADKPLTLVAYDAGPPKTYVRGASRGRRRSHRHATVPRPGWYVSVPLEATYQAAWCGVPRRYRDVLDRRD